MILEVRTIREADKISFIHPDFIKDMLKIESERGELDDEEIKEEAKDFLNQKFAEFKELRISEYAKKEFKGLIEKPED